MMHWINMILATLVALLPIANPFSTAAVFLGITADNTERERRVQAIRACLYMFIILGLAAVTLICLGALIASTTVVKFLGTNGMNAMTRIMGFLLLCVGVQFIVSGVIGIVAEETFLERLLEMYHRAVATVA